MCTCLMRDEEGRKEEASKDIHVQTIKQSNRAHPKQSLLQVREMKKEGRKKQTRSNKAKQHSTHPRQSLYLRKISYLGWDVHVHVCVVNKNHIDHSLHDLLLISASRHKVEAIREFR